MRSHFLEVSALSSCAFVAPLLKDFVVCLVSLEMAASYCLAPCPVTYRTSGFFKLKSEEDLIAIGAAHLIEFVAH